MTEPALQFEVCIDNYADAIQAEAADAARLELCADLALDGLSPSDELLHKVLDRVQIPVMVMVRSRAGGFCYTEQEILQMESEIKVRRNWGAHGFVFGCNQADGMPNALHCSRLLAAAQSLPCTFHRAFDGCPQPQRAIDQLHELGFTRILTSGDHPTAWQSRHTLKGWMAYANNRIQILPAGKVRADHARSLHRQLGCPELHSSSVTIAFDVAAASADGE